MVSKQEVLYNSKSLLSTWLYKKSEFKNLTIEVRKIDGNDCYYPVELGDCAERMAELLYDSHDKYEALKLTGEINGVRELIGSIKIV